MKAPDLPLVFTRGQALDLGISDVRLAGLVRRGHLVRVRQGVYARADPAAYGSPAGLVQASEAALAHHGPGHVLSHLSAAAAWGLPMPLGRLDVVHLTVIGGTQRTRRASGLVVHHADSSETDVTETVSVPLTSPSRTVADCLRGFGARISVPIADAALNRGLTTLDDIDVQLAMQCHWDGRVRSDATLSIVDGRRESWLESYAFVRFAQWGVDLPEPQVIVLDEAGRFVARTDAAWLQDATVLELDGKAKYELPVDGVVDPDAVWEREKARFDRLGNLGLERVRFGLDALLSRESQVRSQIKARRRMGSLGRFTGSFRPTPPSGLTHL